ncbi:MAG: NIPSNAP family protein [Burkholderiaceae bacterium]
MTQKIGRVMDESDGSTVHVLRKSLATVTALADAMLAVPFGADANAAAPARRATPLAQATPACCPVVELRQYTLYPGKRDALIALFEDKFIESQEDVGIHVVGQFRDINDANRFVWVRGFESMEARLEALTGFYYGPVWQAHREQANPMLYDNDNVLLLHPATAGRGFAVNPGKRPARGAALAQKNEVNKRFVVATLYYFDGDVPATFVAQFDHALAPLFEKSGAHLLARYVSEKSRNTFERLPVRDKDNVFVWFASYADRAAYDHFIDALAGDQHWSGELFANLNKALQKPPETLMLQPTPRSLVGN